MLAGSVPLDSDVAEALAGFFHGGAGPSHSVISRALIGNGYDDGYQPPASGQFSSGLNKEQGVLTAFRAARREPARARGLVEDLLSALGHHGLVGHLDDADTPSENEQRLRIALSRTGWYLSADGQLRAGAGIDISTGGRAAFDEQLERLRRSTADPALLLGTAKELLESVAKFVLEELEWPVPKSYDELWHLARERLGILPQQVDPNLAGSKQLKAIYGSIWNIAEQTNELRNLQGTGHGRTLPAGVSEDLAMLVVREACTVADFMLSSLERMHGRRS